MQTSDFFQKLFKMIVEIAVALFLIYGLSVISRLLARCRDVFPLLRRAAWWTRPVDVQRSVAPLGVKRQLLDDSRSKLFHRQDGWRLSVTTDLQPRGVGAGERVSSGPAEAISRKPLGRHACEPPSGQLFRPSTRPPLGPRPRTKLPL
jgi:hypothetical protein